MAKGTSNSSDYSHWDGISNVYIINVAEYEASMEYGKVPKFWCGTSVVKKDIGVSLTSW